MKLNYFVTAEFTLFIIISNQTPIGELLSERFLVYYFAVGLGGISHRDE